MRILGFGSLGENFKASFDHTSFIIATSDAVTTIQLD
jgi:hypothetical protein